MSPKYHNWAACQSLTTQAGYDFKKHPVKPPQTDTQMNRFQAMAKIMAMLTEDGTLKPASREYTIARKLVSRKIDRLGPDAALIQVVDRRHHLMEQIDILKVLEESGAKLPPLDF